jgi:2-polyprenyl-6-methoxyphenol hydroxylase-like FAD-dependent oxidoreductase
LIIDEPTTAPAPDPAVLIVGAGPVGLVLACELARRDVGLRLIDKLPRPTTESRAIVVHARSLEMLERIGVVDELMATGIKVTGAQFHADGVTRAEIALNTVDSPYPFSVTLPQTETERILRERLAGLGVTVEQGTELVGFDQDEGLVRARLRREDGRDETVASSWIAGTDGSHSTVRSATGAHLEGSFKGERFLMGDVEADYDLDRSSMHTFFSPGTGPIVVFPMRGERTRLIAQLTDEADVDAGEPTLERMQAVADERAGGIKLLEAHWLTVFEIHHAQVPQYRHGRAFLAGDAAHVHSPAGGQGMNTGMQDAFNLGWKLALAADGRAAPGLLDSYHAERHPVAARVIKQTTRMTTMATLHGKGARALRNHLVHLAAGLAPVRAELADQTEETNINYRDSPLVAGAEHAAGPKPGDAAPDVAGLSLHSVLADGTGHTLLQVGGAPAKPEWVERTAVRRVLVSDRTSSEPDYDVTVFDAEHRIQQRYGVAEEGALFAIRPDGYVGLRADVEDGGALAAYLDNVMSK